MLVASDRISTFDVVLPTEMPDKGRVLTGLSGVLVRAHARASVPTTCSRCGRTAVPPSAGGWTCCRSSASSAATWPGRAGRTTSRPARCAATSCPRGCASRSACRSRSSRPRRRRRRATTRTSTRAQADRARRRGALPRAGAVSLELYGFASELGGRARDHPRRHEARARPRRRGARSCSPTRHSRLTRPASGRPTSTRRAVRSRRSTSSSCATTARRSAGTRRRPARSCPHDVVAGTRARYVEAFERLTGIAFDDYLGDPDVVLR